MNLTWHQWLRRLAKAVGSQKSRRQPSWCARSHLQLEGLESRVVLTAPAVSSINRLTPLAPETSASSVIYDVEFTQSVTGVAASDFQVVPSGPVAASGPVTVSGSGGSYQVTIAGIHGNGNLGLNLVNNGSISNGNGALGNSFTGQLYSILQTDPQAVSINRMTPSAALTNAGSVTFTVTFSESVTGVNSSDFLLAETGTVGATLTQVTPVSGSVYLVSVSGITGSGSIGLNLVDNDSIHDLAGNPLVQSNAAASFATAVNYTTGAGPSFVAVADLNADGKPDLVTANYPGTGSNSNTVSVLLGNGNGTFQAAQNFSTGSSPGSVVVADVNGDGKPDLVVANRLSNTVSVLLGNGNGTFQAAQNFSTGTMPYSLAVADFNGDGKPDLVVANKGSSTVSVLLGNGDGTFQAAQNFSTGTTPYYVAAADVNGDGKPDLVVTNNASNTVSVLLGNGDGTFQAAVNFSTGLRPRSVAVADVNGDGKPDLVAANFASNTVSVLLGNGNGTFQAALNFSTGNGAYVVAVADVNGDGKPDLLVTNTLPSGAGSNTVSVLLGNGDGTFQAAQNFSTGAEPIPVVVADLNGDGRPDLVVGNFSSNTVSVLLGNGNGDFTGQVYTIDQSDPSVLSINRTIPAAALTNAGSVTYTVTFSENVTGVALADFQLAETGPVSATLSQVTPVNGSVYLVSVGSVTGNGSIGLNLVNNGSIRDLAGNPLVQTSAAVSLASAVNYTTGGVPLSVAVADVNADGKPDLVVANFGDNFNTVSVLLGNGDGTFQAAVNYSAGMNPRYVAVADVNGDGKPDLVVANYYSNYVSVLLGNGNGTFQAAVNYSTGLGPRSIAVADVNGDGKPDLIVADEAGSSLSVLLGNGNGTFQTAQNLFLGAEPFSVAAADVNGDGIPDLVTANYNGNTVSVLLGNGNGTFQAAVNFSTGLEPYSLAVTDVNGDGKPDIVTANYGANSVSVLLGNGNGSFQTAQSFSTNQGPTSVAVADVNGDGMPDLVTANFTANTVSVLLGNGNGTFQTAQSFSTNMGPASVAVADLNNDGRPDLVTANTGGNNVSVLLGINNDSFAGQVYTIDQIPPVASASPLPGTETNTTFNVPYTATDANGVAYVALWYTTNNGTNWTQFGGTFTSSPITFTAASGNSTIGFYVQATDNAGNSDSIPSGPGSVQASTQISVPLSSSTTTLTDNGPTPSLLGQGVSFTINVSGSGGAITGSTVALVDASAGDTTIGTATLTGGSVTFSDTFTTAGTHDVFAFFPGDATHLASGSSTVAQTVSGLLSSIGILPPVETSATFNLFWSGSSDTPGYSISSYTVYESVNSSSFSVVPGLSNDTATTAAFAGQNGNTYAFYVVANGTNNTTSPPTPVSSPNSSVVATAVQVNQPTLIVTSFTPLATGFSVTFNEPFLNNSTNPLHLYTSSALPLGAPDVTLVGTDTGNVVGSLLVNSTNTGFTFIKTDEIAGLTGADASGTAGLLAADNYTVTLVSTFGGSSFGFQSLFGTPLGGNQSNVPGTNYTMTFTPPSPPAAVVVSIPDFARGPDGTDSINLPNNSPNGIPLQVSNGAGLTSGTITVTYNPALLNVGVGSSSVFATPALVTSNGVTLTVDPASTPGNLILDFAATTPLASGPVILGGIVATVPSNAVYKSKEVLQIGSTLLAGSATVATINDNAIQVVAYLGDTAGTGGSAYSSGDPTLVLRASTNFDGTNSGFGPFPVIDPVILGDVANVGSLTGAATLIARFLGGGSTPQIPPRPGASNVPTGPDPSLSLPSILALGSDGTVLVPVNIDDPKPAGSNGMLSAQLALQYDPSEFTVTPQDVQLGSITSSSGWTVQTVVDQSTGALGITLWGYTPIDSSAGGSLVIIALQKRPTATPSSTPIALVASVNLNGRSFSTTVDDVNGPFTLTPAPSNSGNVPGQVATVLLSPNTIGSTAPVNTNDGEQSDPAFTSVATTAVAASSVVNADTPVVAVETSAMLAVDDSMTGPSAAVIPTFSLTTAEVVPTSALTNAPAALIEMGREQNTQAVADNAVVDRNASANAYVISTNVSLVAVTGSSLLLGPNIVSQASNVPLANAPASATPAMQRAADCVFLALAQGDGDTASQLLQGVSNVQPGQPGPLGAGQGDLESVLWDRADADE